MKKTTRRKLIEQEKNLGSPFDAGRPFNFKDILAADEEEAFPEKTCREFDRLGLTEWMVPSEYGGCFESCEDLIQAARLVSRRDLSTSAAKGKCVLASLPTWVAGEESLKRRISDVVLRGGFLSLGLTERGNGSDLNQTQLTADRKGAAEYALSGEKWIINNATKSTCISLLARTNPAGGMRGFSLFLFDKEKSDPSSFQPLPKIKTLGVRGIDISGLTLRQAAVSSSDLIGREGQGLEIALKALQVSRTVCAGFCLGPAETLLRLVFEFCQKRKLYGDSVLKIPNVRSRLVRNYGQLLLCELTARYGSRMLHLRPEQASLASALTKYFVPWMTEKTVQELCTTLGARFYLREEFCEGIAQKIFRDVQLIGLFDGSSQVNLYVIANQLRAFSEQRRTNGSQAAEFDSALLQDEVNLPPVEYRRLQMTNRGEDPLLRALIGAFDGSFPGSGAEPPHWSRIVGLLRDALADFDADVLSGDPREPQNHRLAFEWAHRLCWLQVAALTVLAPACGALADPDEASYLLHLCLPELGLESPLRESELRDIESRLFAGLQRKIESNLSLGLFEDPVADWYGHL